MKDFGFRIGEDSLLSSVGQSVEAVGGFLGRTVSWCLSTTEPDRPLPEFSSHIPAQRTAASSSLKAGELLQGEVDVCWIPSFLDRKQFIAQDKEFMPYFLELAKVECSDSYLVPVYIKGFNDLDLPTYNSCEGNKIYLLPSHLFKNAEENKVSFTSKGQKYQLEMTDAIVEFINDLENTPLESSITYNIPDSALEIPVFGISLPKKYSEDCLVYRYSAEKGCVKQEGEARQEVIKEAVTIANTPLAKLNFSKHVLRDYYDYDTKAWVPKTDFNPQVMVQRYDAKSSEPLPLKDGKGMGILFEEDPRFDTLAFSVLVEGDDLLIFSRDCSRDFLKDFNYKNLEKDVTLKEAPYAVKLSLGAKTISRLDLAGINVRHFGSPCRVVDCSTPKDEMEKIMKGDHSGSPLKYDGRFLINIPSR